MYHVEFRGAGYEAIVGSERLVVKRGRGRNSTIVLAGVRKSIQLSPAQMKMVDEGFYKLEPTTQIIEGDTETFRLSQCDSAIKADIMIEEDHLISLHSDLQKSKNVNIKLGRGRGILICGVGRNDKICSYPYQGDIEHGYYEVTRKPVKFDKSGEETFALSITKSSVSVANIYIGETIDILNENYVELFQDKSYQLKRRGRGLFLVGDGVPSYGLSAVRGSALKEAWDKTAQCGTLHTDIDAEICLKGNFFSLEETPQRIAGAFTPVFRLKPVDKMEATVVIS